MQPDTHRILILSNFIQVELFKRQMSSDPFGPILKCQLSSGPHGPIFKIEPFKKHFFSQGSVDSLLYLHMKIQQCVI